MFETYRRFLGLRLRWYAHSSGQLLLRHWQWLVIGGLFVPGLPLLAILEAPTRALITATTPGHDFPRHLGAIAAVQLAAILWIVPQRGALRGGEFAQFSKTFPVAGIVRQSVDVTLLLVADTLLLLPVFCALASAKASQPLALPALVLTTIVFQIAALKKSRLLIAPALVADLTLACSLTWTDYAWAFVPACGVLLVGFFKPARLPENSASSRLRSPRRKRSLKPMAAPGAALKIRWHILASHPVGSVLRIGSVLALAFGADRLALIFNFDGRTLPALILAMASGAAVLSGLYRVLYDGHRPMRSYYASLPLRRHYSAWNDIIFVMLFGLAPFVILLSTVSAHALLSRTALVTLTTAYLALVAILRLALIWGGALSVMLGALLAAGWAGAAMAAVSR